MASFTRSRISTVAAVLGIAAVAGVAMFAASNSNAARDDYQIAQKPLYTGQSVPPLMMMVMSRDERLFTKAYSDYTDLDGDGVVDTTYNDEFSYAGYFDPNLCYDYNNGHGRFSAKSAASGAHGHYCSNRWSGNFLNWMTMSRLDIVRHVLYGGKRSVDKDDKTVLQGAHIPNDLHAWVKVYSGTDVASLAPLSGNTFSFCVASFDVGQTPKIRVASGNWSEWAATALSQCNWRAQAHNDAKNDTPTAKASGTDEMLVQVNVCASGDGKTDEAFCADYENGRKPTGLLQSYGESGRLRFGLLTGSYSQPRSGGVLRRNIGKIAGNGDAPCTAGDEINVRTGQFCNQTSGSEGIINTVDRFQLDRWSSASTRWTDCSTWGINNRTGGSGQLKNPGNGSYECNAWGNPIAEMYAEALRYIAGETSATPAFIDGSDLAGLPTGVQWKDPYRSPAEGGNSYCADCSILVLSSGLSSFDSDELPSVPRGIGDGTAATTAVGAHEGIAGSYLVGRVGTTPKGSALNTHEDICSAETVGDLSLVRGICPDIPSLEGSYMLAGLAHKGRTTDLRPNLQGKPSDYKNTVTTYAVALADNLPKFDVPVGGGTITLSPLCQANGTSSAKITSTGWRTCHLGSVSVGKRIASIAPNHEYGRPLQLDGQGRAVAGSFSLVWEDSLWGNDHDNDVVAMLTYCVGSSCAADTNPRNGSYSGHDICWRSDSSICTQNNHRPLVGDNEVLVRIENLSAYAGNAMLSGFAITGSDQDGVHKLALRPGSTDGSLLTSRAEPDGGNEAKWDKPKVMKFRRATSEAKLLETPLWYAAKYGGFKDGNANGMPDNGEWDTRKPGVPDNYFFARDPSSLKSALEAIFEEASGGGGPTGGGGAGARIGADSFTIEVGYDLPDETNDWKGFLRAVRVGEDGGRSTGLWDAAEGIPAHGSRNILMASRPTVLRADGSLDVKVQAEPFNYQNLPGTSQPEKAKALGLEWSSLKWPGSLGDVVDYLRGKTVSGLRTRTSRLGDIVNSDVAISLPRDDYGYGAWRFDNDSDKPWKAAYGESYRSYVEAKTQGSRRAMAYVGANDGMLHGFTADESGGQEEFAFIPYGSLRHLGELASPDYDHQYYVDGGLALGDVPFSGSGNWKTVLVGTTGAGGAARRDHQTTVSRGSVYALDVSSPSSFAAANVLWELSGFDHDDLGFTLGKPHIVPVKGPTGPRWVALFGNGPNSRGGAPVLFVVDAKTGEILRTLKPANGDHAVKNGLMNIAPVAMGNSDGLVDAVYGGDLQGNIWKFDLSGSSASQWNVAFSGAPLFTARRNGSPQPITGTIEVSRGPIGGATLFFGTGRYFAEGDNENHAVQSLYSIWDAPGAGAIDSGRSQLVQQVISHGTSSHGYTTRNVSHNTVNYGNARGWFVDLLVKDDAAGERFIGEPQLQSGKVIFTTYVPGEAVCSAGGGTNWQYALDLLSGGGAMRGVSTDPAGDDPVCLGEECGAISLKKGDDPSAPVKSVEVFVPKPLRPGVGAPVCPPGEPACEPDVDELLEAGRCTFVLHTPGADPLYLPRPCGRQSWRQVR
ncbi:pilus assembly protein PilC [Lysobacter sp. GX 14042]|uniref:pilus assembly protein n=1 Tax=Lysobacter sp. GX 14042 TaxID=2907155 RepID=UPI001F3E710C|nr:PilC/PilY family type IV pilus protein [Lysobacter sp. GX 14042]MCE7031780.1 pilus assembly protein PilC [Lysobacter sp. GX 14042]